VHRATVYLKASGKALSGPNASNEVTSEATGFIVSEEGLVMTVHHLISKLGDVAPKTVKLEARIGSRVMNPIPIGIVDARITTDMLILQLIEPDAYPNVKLGSAYELDDGAQLYSFGFHSVENSQPEVKSEGKIKCRCGPGGFLWDTSFDFTYGQSGSPVYDAEGTVVGMLKGTDDDSGYMIPIGMNDTLLALIRLREIQTAMADFDQLRRQFRWDVEIVQRGNNNIVLLNYQKSVSGEPLVAEVQISPRVNGRNSDGDFREQAMASLKVARTATEGSGGFFELPLTLQDITTFGRLAGISEMVLVLDIIPSLSDGTDLKSDKVTLDLRGAGL
jgi:hypothetical protein